MYNAGCRHLYMSPGGGDSGDASEKASEAQLQATREALQLEREIFNRQLQAQAPGRNIGNQALATLGGLYGFDPGTDIAPIDPLSEGVGQIGGAVGQPGTSSQNALLQGGNFYAKPGIRGQPYQTGGTQQITNTMTPGTAGTMGTTGTGATAGSTWKPPITAGSGQSLLDLDPGYAFRQSEQQKALDRQASAAGGLYSGGQLKAAQRYGGELASQEYGNAYNRLAALAGLQQTGTQGVTNALSSFGNTSSGLIQRAGDARASGYINAANANSGPSTLGRVAGGAASGALSGAAIGAAGGPIGAGTGALIGGLGGLFF